MLINKLAEIWCPLALVFEALEQKKKKKIEGRELFEIFVAMYSCIEVICEVEWDGNNLLKSSTLKLPH